jgi:hypothetical protein
MEVTRRASSSFRALGEATDIAGFRACRSPHIQHVPHFTSTQAENVGLPIVYSGGLQIGKDLIRGLYTHRVFPSAWKFSQVHELVFDQGSLVEARDLSDAMALLRARMRDEPQRDPMSARDQITDWIRRCFRRTYPG